MATLETQFKEYQYDNPTSKLSFEECKASVLSVQGENIIKQINITEQIIELKKLPATQTTKLLIQKLQQQMDESYE
jgi:hypothetical protein